jgi:hypothetical protein
MYVLRLNEERGRTRFLVSTEEVAVTADWGI